MLSAPLVIAVGVVGAVVACGLALCVALHSGHGPSARPERIKRAGFGRIPYERALLEDPTKLTITLARAPTA